MSMDQSSILCTLIPIQTKPLSIFVMVPGRVAPVTIKILYLSIYRYMDISGNRAHGCHLNVATYVDDLLFYITNPIISLPSLLQEFQKFGSSSNLKVNITKI